MECTVKDIIGYEGLYTIDTEGKIFGIRRGMYLKNNKTTTYSTIILSKNNKSKYFRLHRLIAMHFIPNPENKLFVLHLDNNKQNFEISNLKWGTQNENILESYETGAQKTKKGENHSSSILNNKQVLEIYYAYGSQSKIGKHFNISQSHIKDIKNKKKWKHLLKETDNVKFKGDCGYLMFEGKEIKFNLLLKTDLKDNRKEKEIDVFLSYQNKPIVGYPNYLIDIMGNVYSLTNKKYLKQSIYNNYYRTCLYNSEGKAKKAYIHILVAITFIPNQKNKPLVNHLDGIKINNNVSNLEWVTHKENSEHAVKTGLLKPKQGTDNPNSTLTNEEVLEIYYSNLSQKAIAEKFNVSNSIISLIKSVKHYKNILIKDDIQLSPIKYVKKLIDSDILKIYNSTLSLKQLSEIYNVNISTISSIKNVRKHKKLLLKSGAKISPKKNTDRLTDIKVLEIYYSKLPKKELMKKFNISRGVIYNIQYKLRYKKLLNSF